jgi:radical SAM-linked protein
VAAEPKQRWRLIFSRGRDAPRVTHRELVDAWLSRLEASGLPLPRIEGSRPRPPVTFAAPLPVGMSVERDLADLLLAARLPVADVRPVVDASMVEGLRLLEVHDVWLGMPPLAGSVAAADYRVIVRPPDATAIADLRRAAERFLASDALPRNRPRGTSTVTYDLRPLVADVSVDATEDDAATAAQTAIVRTRTRFHPERGAGRPEEVVAQLAEFTGVTLEIDSIVRERIILHGDEAATV